MTMHLPAKYSWQEAYFNALGETDKAQIPIRLNDAIVAVEQRLLSPLEPQSMEWRAIQEAKRGIDILRAEQSRRLSH
jgi:hypothetical protein